LIASVLDSRALMFAMPKSKRYGYLELLDVTGLIVDNGSSTWSEREWRRRLKESTGTRMNAIDDGTLSGSNGSARSSYGGGNSNQSLARPKVGFADGEQVPNRTSRSFSLGGGPQRTDSAPPDARNANFKPAMSGLSHSRNSSDPSVGVGAPAPPPQQSFMQRQQQQQQMSPQRPGRPMDAGSLAPPSASDLHARNLNTPEPVSRPPAFNHSPEARPTSKVYHSPELRRANSRLSVGTLAQLAGAGGLAVSNNLASGDANNRTAQEDGTVFAPSAHADTFPSLVLT
jgi:CCR4-NOT transcriptional complex subunit CAF120